jgi:hypothetical protein
VPSALAFGALAIDTNDGARHGAASDEATVGAARARALAECGDRCNVVIAFRRFCAAYAADRTPGSRAWGRSGAPTQAEAERKALDNCRLYDGNACEVRLSACDSDAGSGGVASFEFEPPVVPDGWSRFEQRVLQDQMPDYTRTRTRRIDYFRPRDLPEGSLTRLVDDFFDFIDSEVMPVAPDRRFKVLISRKSQHADNLRALFGDTSPPDFGGFYPREDVLAVVGVGSCSRSAITILGASTKLRDVSIGSISIRSSRIRTMPAGKVISGWLAPSCGGTAASRISSIVYMTAISRDGRITSPPRSIAR